MVSGGAVYCFDTSSLLHAWRRAYPPKRFSRLWACFDDLIEEGRMVASIEVLNELKKKDDDVFEWAKDRKESMFLEIDEKIQVQIGQIMADYPRLVDTKTGKSGGDPFVIAQAMIQNPHYIIVTEEQGGSSKSPKIPYVCIQEGLRHINLLTLIEDEDWSFS